jgi:hypothetical protein
MNRGGSRVPLLLTVLAVLVFVGVVAVASSGSTPTGTADGRPPGDVVLDTFFSFALLALIPAFALVVYGLAQRKEIAREMASGRYRRTSFASFLVFAALFIVAVYGRIRHWSFLPQGQTQDVVDFGDGKPVGAPVSQSPAGKAYEPEFAWIPVLAVVSLAALALGAYMLAARRRKRSGATGEGEMAEHLADVLEDTLDDLRAEPDPRRAVIAAFARLERALAASGVPRGKAETAEEYVVRVLRTLDVDRGPVRTLGDLFASAKFSQHEVDARMKDTAIEALQRIRDELRSSARRQDEERQQTLRAHEQATGP